MGVVTSSIASKYAFYPPNPPSYNIKEYVTGLFVLDIHPNSKDVDILKIKTRKNTEIIGVYVKYPTAKSILIYSHGNAADIGQMYEIFLKLSISLKINILGYDYSGYGQSSGKPTENNTYADIEAAYKCLEENYGAKQEDVILYGQSIGSGPTLDLASRLPRLRAVVLHSPIMSGLRVMWSIKRSFWFDIYKNIDKISSVKCPILVIHGTDDEIVDFSHGETLWKLSQEKYEPLWIKGGQHCDLDTYPQYINHLKKFVSTVGKPPSQRDNTSQISIDKPVIPRMSVQEALRKSTNKREKIASNIKKFEKLIIPFEPLERSRLSSVESYDEFRKRNNFQFQKARNSVDWVNRIRPI